MTRSPFWFGECYDYGLKIATCAQCTAAILIWGDDQKRDSDAQVFCMAVTNRAGIASASSD
jgi:hypothetical protein